MQDPKSTSTLELVINEQPAHNMSQVDLSAGAKPEHSRHPTAGPNQQALPEAGGVWAQLRRWPGACRHSLSAKLAGAKSRSETKTELCFELVNEFASVAVWTLCFLCTITVPILLFIVGLLNLDNCSARPSLPYLMFAMGFLMSASNLFNLALALDWPVLSNHRSLHSDVKNIIASIINILLNCLVGFLFVLTAYMVYNLQAGDKRIDPMYTTTTTEQPSLTNADEPTAMEQETAPGFPQCGATLYGVAFWFITLTLGTFIVLGVVAAVLFAYNRYRIAIIKGSMPRSQAQPNLSSGQPIETDHSATGTGNRF